MYHFIHFFLSLYTDLCYCLRQNIGDKMTKHFDSSEIAEMYNKMGKIYHQTRVQGGRLFNEFLEMPATLALIPENLSGKLVLDAGCGSGIYAREMANRGASVIGIDISSTMIEIAASETPKDLPITYQVGNLYQLDLKSSSIDLIICNYVLENIQNIDEVFSEFNRVLKNDGVCIYSISHPIRAMAKREEVNGDEIWKLEDYYDRGIRISDFGQGMKIKKYKRTISDYMNACIKAGFNINQFCEPQPILAGKTNDIKSYNLAMRLPQLLVIKMNK